jgi:hypothetical protein
MVATLIEHTAVTIESLSLPRHGTSRTPCLVTPPGLLLHLLQALLERGSAATSQRHPPRLGSPISTVASYQHEPRSTDRLASLTRVSKEKGRERKTKERRKEWRNEEEVIKGKRVGKQRDWGGDEGWRTK